MPLQLSDLDNETLACVLAALPAPEDLARAAMTCAAFRSALEPALRLRVPVARGGGDASADGGSRVQAPTALLSE